MKLVFAPVIETVAVALADTTGAIPEQGPPGFDAYMQARRRRGFNLKPNTAWSVVQQACVGGIPGYIGGDLAAQGVVGHGAAL